MLQGRTYQTRCQQLKLPALKVLLLKKVFARVCIRQRPRKSNRSDGIAMDVMENPFRAMT